MKNALFKKTICFLVLLSAMWPVTSVKACGSAYHYRSFPAGICNEGLVMIEMYVVRHPDGVQFDMTADLVVYNHKKEALSTKRIDTLHLDSFLLEPIQKLYLKGLSMAKSKKNMQWAVPTDIYLCGFHDTCEVGKIIHGDDYIDSLQLLSGKTYRIVCHVETDNNLEKELNWEGTYPANMAMRGSHISSFRTYTIGSRKLYVTHIGTADADWETGEFYYPYKPHKPDTKFKKLNESFYMEEMLGHGEGFDFFVLE